jgi:prepilin-type N-terminal cleavage/methylation domain-containing protein/prepilin-type processing-associated H-X9-DG protein
MKHITNRLFYQAFTLIELLVVIAIIALLAAILFPVFAQAREKARETVCVSNLRQIGTAVRMYVQDYDESFPIFHAYNSNPAPGQAGHKGVEVSLEPYTKARDLFQCPNDQGSPYLREVDVPGAESYHAGYGSSYRFTASCFTLVAGPDGSYQNNAPMDLTGTTYQPGVRTDASFEYPSETRLMRDEQLPWFGPDKDPGGTKYGYTGYEPSYYQQWHTRGGGIVYADGHAKFVASEGAFRKIRATPDGKSYDDGCWFGCE